MAVSSDEFIKREITQEVGLKVGIYSARVFSEGSDDDQKLFQNGGLTFTHLGQDYGSCDCVYVERNNGSDRPILAIEGTDCLSRGSSGNAQYQRFHHILGAVKQGIIGVYYLRKGDHKVQPDLYGMAYRVSQTYKTPYLIVQDLFVIKDILMLMNKGVSELNSYIEQYQKKTFALYEEKFRKDYQNSWEKFADKRSTIIFKDHIVKYSARNKLNFTDSSVRAGHIAVGEMFLTKYSFPDKPFYYLWPRMTAREVKELDTEKSNDKEWQLIRKEPNVVIKTIDDLVGLPNELRFVFEQVKHSALKGEYVRKWNAAAKTLHELIKAGKVQVR